MNEEREAKSFWYFLVKVIPAAIINILRTLLFDDFIIIEALRWMMFFIGASIVIAMLSEVTWPAFVMILLMYLKIAHIFWKKGKN